MLVLPRLRHSWGQQVQGAAGQAQTTEHKSIHFSDTPAICQHDTVSQLSKGLGRRSPGRTMQFLVPKPVRRAAAWRGSSPLPRLARGHQAEQRAQSVLTLNGGQR